MFLYILWHTRTKADDLFLFTNAHVARLGVKPVFVVCFFASLSTTKTPHMPRPHPTNARSCALIVLWFTTPDYEAHIPPNHLFIHQSREFRTIAIFHTSEHEILTLGLSLNLERHFRNLLTMFSMCLLIMLALFALLA